MDTYLEKAEVNPDQKITKIFLLRHAESVANSQGINAGRLDISLSDKGKKDSKDFGVTYANKIDFDAVYCTTLKRTSETYACMKDGWDSQHTNKRLPALTSDNGFIERDNGNLEGMEKKDYGPLKDKETNFLEKVVKFEDLFNYRIPEGGDSYESLNHIWKRAVPALNAVAQRHLGGTVLIISHVGVLRALIVGCAAAMENPVTLNYRKFDIKNCGMIAIESNGDGIRLKAASPFDYEKKKAEAAAKTNLTTKSTKNTLRNILIERIISLKRRLCF